MHHDMLAEHDVGFGEALNSPSSIIACAPCAVSSAGWKTAISVPCHASRTSRTVWRADQPGHVHIVTTSMHHRHVFPSRSVAMTLLA